MEFTLLAAVLIGVLPIYLVLRWDGHRCGSGVRDLWDIALSAAVIGLFVGRLAAMISAGVSPIAHPADIFIVRGGVATGPATTAALAAVVWMGRRDQWSVLDGLAPAAVAGLGGWHAGCLVRGACLGTPSDLPWAVAQGGSGITRHPVEIYAALALIAAAVTLVLVRPRLEARPGSAAGIALFVAAAVRLATEPMRPALGSGPVGWYSAGVLAGASLVLWALRPGRKPALDQNTG